MTAVVSGLAVSGAAWLTPPDAGRRALPGADRPTAPDPASSVVARQPAPRRPDGRVVVLSLDGLAHHLWKDDVAARELRALRRIADEGVVARGMIQSFPSITPAGHAALWTGAYGRTNGVVTTQNPHLPRAEHTAFERLSGFDSRALRAEPLWVTAAESGVRAVAHQSTQNHPFIAAVTAPGTPTPPILVSGYGPPMIAPHAVVRADDVIDTDPGRWGESLPESSRPPRTFRWRVGEVELHGALVAEGPAADGYTALRVAARPEGPSVRVAPAPTESDPPRGRPLARHFSDGLPLRVAGCAAAEGPVHTVAYFRLFELSADGERFVLYQPSLHELALHDGEPDDDDARRLLADAGGFIGNGPSYLYRGGDLGRPVPGGGDGTAERRYLEGMELVVRQYNRLSRWLARRYQPGLLLDYAPYPDEVDHGWYGLVRPDVTGVDRRMRRIFDAYRSWAYAALDRRVALLDSLAGPDGHIIVTSDHGMSPVAKEVRVNIVLRRAGLLRLDDDGAIDPARTRAVLLKYCVLLNTDDWRGGIVPLGERDGVLERVRAALSDVVDPDTGERVFTGFYRPEALGDSLGIGGPAGCDLYFEVAPGYAATDGLSGDAIVDAAAPYGAHGFLSTRPEMIASFIARGPRFPRGETVPRMRSIDVAPTVSELLGIRPPADQRGRSVLRAVPTPGPSR